MKPWRCDVARTASIAVLLLLFGGLLAPPPVCAQELSATPDPASSAILFYQRHLSSMRHLHCRFRPSCSQYALDAIAAYGVVEGSARAADRLMRCSPSADSRYPRGSDDLLSDPAVGPAASAAGIQAPGWLLPAPVSTVIPFASRLGGGSADSPLGIGRLCSPTGAAR